MFHKNTCIYLKLILQIYVSLFKHITRSYIVITKGVIFLLLVYQFRYTTSRMTPERASLLSLLLDEVVGTQGIIKLRRDFCRIFDRLLVTGLPQQFNWYYTGSRAEGLDLPGSDNDMMTDINDTFQLTVIQTLDNIPQTFLYSVYLMCTDNVRPGFALLRCVRQGFSPFPVGRNSKYKRVSVSE